MSDRRRGRNDRRLGRNSLRSLAVEVLGRSRRARGDRRRAERRTTRSTDFARLVLRDRIRYVNEKTGWTVFTYDSGLLVVRGPNSAIEFAEDGLQIFTRELDSQGECVRARRISRSEHREEWRTAIKTAVQTFRRRKRGLPEFVREDFVKRLEVAI